MDCESVWSIGTKTLADESPATACSLICSARTSCLHHMSVVMKDLDIQAMYCPVVIKDK
jgi:hypothetical protein